MEFLFHADYKLISTSLGLADFSFLHGLFDILPFVSNDPQAQNAFWCIIARILCEVQENDISISILQQFASLFADNYHLIEQHVEHHSEKAAESSGISDCHKSDAKIASVSLIDGDNGKKL